MNINQLYGGSGQDHDFNDRVIDNNDNVNQNKTKYKMSKL